MVCAPGTKPNKVENNRIIDRRNLKILEDFFVAGLSVVIGKACKGVCGTERKQKVRTYLGYVQL